MVISLREFIRDVESAPILPVVPNTTETTWKKS